MLLCNILFESESIPYCYFTDGDTTRSLPKNGGAEELGEDPQSGHVSRSEPEVKMEVVPKMVRQRGSDAGQSRKR